MPPIAKKKPFAASARMAELFSAMRHRIKRALDFMSFSFEFISQCESCLTAVVVHAASVRTYDHTLLFQFRSTQHLARWQRALRSKRDSRGPPGVRLTRTSTGHSVISHLTSLGRCTMTVRHLAVTRAARLRFPAELGAVAEKFAIDGKDCQNRRVRGLTALQREFQDANGFSAFKSS